MGKGKRLRCAIYTRKSTDDGLEQEFNSLDAQHEACAAYVSSQASLGWRLVPDRFDDGGVSGGTMERSALKRLLTLIEVDRVDVVVVYKIDRLTRSLTDFAKLVDLFDRHRVSFVSVTQQFNTTTSMGRLTLNVLLSFAQFEREVTAERIRDKIAASRKKGLWMGGPVPLGYRAKDKALIPDPVTAPTVQAIFERYLDFKSLRLLALDLQAHPLPGLPRERPVSRGRLSALLSNPVYIGKARHRGQIYEGVHNAIVDTELFDRVQVQITTHAPRRRVAENTGGAHLLTGLIVDEHGDGLSPVHTSKDGKRYLYYVSNPKAENEGGATPRWRLPASELERVVEKELCSFLSNGAELSRLLTTDVLPDQLRDIIGKAQEIAETFPFKRRTDRQALIHSMIQTVQIAPTSLRVRFKLEGLHEILRSKGFNPSHAQKPYGVFTINRTLSIKRRGHEAKIVIEGNVSKQAEPDPGLIALLAKAHHAFDLLIDGTGRSVKDIASHLQADRSDISRLLPLVFLSPCITDAIFEGRQPPALTARQLARTNDVPLIWNDQVAFFGFVKA